MDQLLNWLSEYRLFISLLAGVSILLIIVTVAATPWFLASLPSNYFLPKSLNTKLEVVPGAMVLIFRNIVGFMLVILGFILMLTPGPGLVVLLVGISLAEFPGKHRLLTRIAIHPSVFKSLNWMRSRHGKPPFENPHTYLRE